MSLQKSMGSSRSSTFGRPLATGSGSSFSGRTSSASSSLADSNPETSEVVQDPAAEVRELRNWIREVVKVCHRAAEGDLEPRILNLDRTSDPELAELCHSVNHLLDMTDAFVREATATSEHNSRQDFHRRVLLAGMRGTFRQAATTINEATDSMEQGCVALKEAEKCRKELAKEFDSAAHVVDGLTSASSEIGEMSDLIGQIARQSNLLALNAAIESARAGEAGAGFGVVATEVRNLSDRTAVATRDIAQRVNAIQSASLKVGSTIRSIWKSLHEEG